ncbi:hypothetical protein [Marilutibacter aestuarii]|nr:hypothetical protein [Lysobacter aestuarii]
MNTQMWLTGLSLAVVLAFVPAHAGVLDSHCTPAKAAKSAAAKATVGVGGRCDAKETLKDTADDAIDLDLDADDAKDTLEDVRDKADDAHDTLDDAVHDRGDRDD